MSNMAYCRFQNTLNDLRDCSNWLDEHDAAELSNDEWTAFIYMIALAKEITENHTVPERRT